MREKAQKNKQKRLNARANSRKSEEQLFFDVQLNAGLCSEIYEVISALVYFLHCFEIREAGRNNVYSHYYEELSKFTCDGPVVTTLHILTHYLQILII